MCVLTCPEICTQVASSVLAACHVPGCFLSLGLNMPLIVLALLPVCLCECIMQLELYHSHARVSPDETVGPPKHIAYGTKAYHPCHTQHCMTLV